MGKGSALGHHHHPPPPPSSQHHQLREGREQWSGGQAHGWISPRLDPPCTNLGEFSLEDIERIKVEFRNMFHMDLRLTGSDAVFDLAALKEVVVGLATAKSRLVKLRLLHLLVLESSNTRKSKSPSPRPSQLNRSGFLTRSQVQSQLLQGARVDLANKSRKANDSQQIRVS